MGSRRQPPEIWDLTREKVWMRDGKKCVRCGKECLLDGCQIDHIIPQFAWYRQRRSWTGWNAMKNLRTLCRRCHVLREHMSHNGMRKKALDDGIIDHNWRDQVWE